MASSFRFEHYDLRDFEGLRKALVASIRGDWKSLNSKTAGPTDWTEFVLNWFADAARKDALVDARPPRMKLSRETKGEFMLDLVHTSYPGYGANWQSRGYWEDAMKARGKLELLLALESEWGNRFSSERNLVEVLTDAAKLAAVRARVKILLFASPGKGTTMEENRKELIGMISSLRKKADDLGTPWLLIDIPWEIKDVGDIRFELPPAS